MLAGITSVGFIGSGQLAEVVARALVKNVVPGRKFCYKKQRLVSTLLASDPLPERRQVFDTLGFATTDANWQVLSDCDVVFLGTSTKDALPEAALRRLTSRADVPLFVSLMGSQSTMELEKLLVPGARVVRIMPQTYLEEIGLPKGVLPPLSWAATRGKHASEDDMQRVAWLAGLPSFVEVDERTGQDNNENLLTGFIRSINDQARLLGNELENEVALTAEFDDLFLMQEYLGEGRFCEVYRAVEKATGAAVAIKRLKNDDQLETERSESLIAEVGALSRLSHPHVIAHHGLFSEGEQSYLALDYCDQGSLSRYLQTVGKLEEASAKQFMKQILDALNYCHDMGQVHRDIKPDNVLLSKRDGQLVAKLADFGLSQELDLGSDRLMDLCGTPQFLSPEIVSGRLYGKPADVWSAGIMCYMMLSGKAPFSDSMSEAELFKMIKLGAVFYDHDTWGKLSPEAKDFVQRMLTLAPESRATTKELLSHDWLKDA